MIENLRFHDYILHRTDGSFVPIILELILIDRLDNLQEQDKYQQLLLCAQVSLSLKVRDELGEFSIIQGLADWVLGYGSSQGDIRCMFVIMEAKRIKNTISIGMPQLLICMRAAQEAKRVEIVYGMLSDASTFRFACLTDEDIFQTSEPLTWRTKKSRILDSIDHILLVAIQFGFTDEPQIKVKHPDLKAFRSSLAGPWNSRTGSIEGEEGRRY